MWKYKLFVFLFVSHDVSWCFYDTWGFWDNILTIFRNSWDYSLFLFCFDLFSIQFVSHEQTLEITKKWRIRAHSVTSQCPFNTWSAFSFAGKNSQANFRVWTYNMGKMSTKHANTIHNYLVRVPYYLISQTSLLFDGPNLSKTPHPHIINRVLQSVFFLSRTQQNQHLRLMLWT